MLTFSNIYGKITLTKKSKRKEEGSMSRHKDNNFDDFGLNVGMEETVRSNIVSALAESDLDKQVQAYVVKALIWKTTYGFSIDILRFLHNVVFEESDVAIESVIEDVIDLTYVEVRKALAGVEEFDLELDEYTKYWMCSYLYGIIAHNALHGTDMAFAKEINTPFVIDLTNTEVVKGFQNQGVELDENTLITFMVHTTEDEEEDSLRLGVGVGVRNRGNFDYKAEFLQALPTEVPKYPQELLATIVEEIVKGKMNQDEEEDK